IASGSPPRVGIDMPVGYAVLRIPGRWAESRGPATGRGNPHARWVCRSSHTRSGVGAAGWSARGHVEVEPAGATSNMPRTAYRWADVICRGRASGGNDASRHALLGPRE